MAEGKESKLKAFAAGIKNVPGKVSKDVKSVSKETKIVFGCGTGFLAGLSFVIGRLTKKAPKAAKVTPKAAN